MQAFERVQTHVCVCVCVGGCWNFRILYVVCSVESDVENSTEAEEQHLQSTVENWRFFCVPRNFVVTQRAACEKTTYRGKPC